MAVSDVLTAAPVAARRPWADRFAQRTQRHDELGHPRAAEAD